MRSKTIGSVSYIEALILREGLKNSKSLNQQSLIKNIQKRYKCSYQPAWKAVQIFKDYHCGKDEIFNSETRDRNVIFFIKDPYLNGFLRKTLQTRLKELRREGF